MGAWQFDPFPPQVEFSAKHLGMMTVRGNFPEVTVTGNVDVEHPENTNVEAVVNTVSIRTHNETRDNDLRSSNFLDVENYPTMTFKSTRIEPAGEDRYNVTGDLTIKGNTHAVTLAAVKYGEFNDPMMGHRIGYAAEGHINRRDFVRTFDMVRDRRFIVSNEVQIMIAVELVEREAAEAGESATT